MGVLSSPKTRQRELAKIRRKSTSIENADPSATKKRRYVPWGQKGEIPVPTAYIYGYWRKPLTACSWLLTRASVEMILIFLRRFLDELSTSLKTGFP